MKKLIFMCVLPAIVILTMSASGSEQGWAIKGDMTESCSCNPACPCNFGSPPTRDHCHINGLIEIKQGYYGNTRLDGISFVYTGRLGGWIKYSVSENATDAQIKAIPLIMSRLYELPADMKVLSAERTAIAVERTETRVKFSVPTSTVEIEMMKGMDGKPIRIQNLPGAYAFEYTQYETVANSHHSKNQQFDYSGTNGFTSKIDAAGNQ